MTAYVIDGKGHLMGRLASICAKELLEGKKIIVVRCEKIEKSGSHIRNKLKFISRSKKRTTTNPKRGPFHFKTPSQVFWKSIRGMLPHKTFRGSNALMRLKLFDGVPSDLIHIRKLVVPSALRVIRLAPNRRYSQIGKIFSELGWNKQKLIQEKEENLKTLGKIFWKKKYNLIHKNKEHLYKNSNLRNLKVIIG